MGIIVKLAISGMLALSLFIANVFYRVYFVPEIISNVAQQQMDRNQGDAPAIIMRTHVELADWGAFFSSVFLCLVILILFSPEIAKALRSSKQGAPTCGENGPSLP